MSKQSKQLEFREPDAPFVIQPNLKEQQINKGLQALARDLSARMSVSLTEATILVVMCSGARHWFSKKGVPEYLLGEGS